MLVGLRFEVTSFQVFDGGFDFLCDEGFFYPVADLSKVLEWGLYRERVACLVRELLLCSRGHGGVGYGDGSG